MGNYELSAKILDHKMEDIEKTAAEIVDTGCMGCLMQLQQGIHNWVLKIKAKPFIGVLDQMIDETGKEAKKNK